MEEWSKRCNIADFEDRERLYELRNVGSFQKLQRQVSEYFPEPPERYVAI